MERKRVTFQDANPASGRRVSITDVLLCISLVLNILSVIVLRLVGSQMYPFYMVVYAWIASYALLLTTILRKQRLDDAPIISSASAMFLVLLLAAGVRLIFIGSDSYISLDPLWYLGFGKHMTMGDIPYYDFYFPYPPVFSYFILLIMELLPTPDGFRILAILCDLGIIAMIWLLSSKRQEPEHTSLAIIAYAMLPISIIESGWNGHFESLVNLLLLISLYFLLQKRGSLSGVFLGLSIATKFYPIFLFPVGFFYVRRWKQRIEFFVATVLTTIATFVPVALMAVFRNATSPVEAAASAGSGLLYTVMNAWLSFDFSHLFISILAIIGILLGIVTMIRQIERNDSTSALSTYYMTSEVIGILLVGMGIFASIYPFLPIAYAQYWRYPMDLAVVRGVTTIPLGIVVMVIALRGKRAKSTYKPSLESVLLLVGFAILLFSSLSREVFFGWYLLWAIPVLFLIRDKKLFLTILLCLLLFYPSYTNDNFSTLGYQEMYLWQDDFNGISGWQSTFQSANATLLGSLVTWNTTSKDGAGLFSWNATGVSNSSLLQNTSITFSKQVQLTADSSIDFLARIKVSWNPMFGDFASLAVLYKGTNSSGGLFNGTFIQKTNRFTNLSYLTSEYSFQAEHPYLEGAVVDRISIIIYPEANVTGTYFFDYMYTTKSGLLNPISFIMVPVLTAFSLASYVVLNEEMKREDYYS